MPSLAEQLEQSRREHAELLQRYALLEEELRWLKQQVFGRSSEKRSAEDIPPAQYRLLFNEAELSLVTDAEPAPVALSIPSHQRKKPGRKAIPEQLPRIEVVHDLSDEEKVCPHDGATLERIGEEAAEQLDYVPARRAGSRTSP